MDDWTLNPEQLAHMVKYKNMIADAYEKEDMAWLRHFSSQPEFNGLFGDMTFDEAYDRYECMVEGG